MHVSKHVLNREWSLVVAVVATIAAVEIPARLVIGYGTNVVSQTLEWVCLGVFLADFLYHMHQGGWLRLGFLPAPPKPPRAFTKGWFLADLLPLFPFGLLPLPPLCQLLRLLKLARIAESMHRWRLQAVHQANQLRLVFFMFWLGLLTHWIACAWLALRGLPPEFDKTTHYIRALYWTVTTLATVGYGDITPTNNPQMLFAIVVMMLGAAVYGYVIANVASILANIDPAKVRYQEIMERITAFMKYRNIPPHLQQRILDYNSYLWEKRLGYDESSAIAGLPPSLRGDVSLYLNREIIEKVPLFRGASEDFVRAVALEMRPVIFTPGDYIMRAGEPGGEMYFISRGSVEIVAMTGEKILATLGAGDFFGELALLLDQPRVASARAVDYCDLYVLEKGIFKHILARFPDFAAHVEAVASKRREPKPPVPSPG